MEHPSRSAVCTIGYPILETLTIFAVLVEITSGVVPSQDTAESSSLSSQRLRDKVIRELVSNHLAVFEQYFAIQFWAEKDARGKHRVPVDHSLLLAPANMDDAEVERPWTRCATRMSL
jgi:hypothetical protein